ATSEAALRASTPFRQRLEQAVERIGQGFEFVRTGGDQGDPAVAPLSKPRQVAVCLRASVGAEEQQPRCGERDFLRLRLAQDLLRVPEDQRPAAHLAAPAV